MKVKQFATVVSGATPSKKHPEYYGGDIVWFTPKDLSDSGRKYMKRGQLSLTKDGFDSCSASMIPAHSVLMSSRAPIGLLAINETECCTNQGFKSIVPNQEICLTEYLYYYLKQNIKVVESLGSGTTFKEVDKASLEDVNIELPSIAEQHAVSSVLSVLDDAIDNNNSICADLEAAAKLLYDYWFVQFDFPDENGKPYKSSGGKMVWSDELKREIPAGWTVSVLSDLCETRLGGTPDTDNQEYWDGDLPWLSSGEVAKSPILKSEKRITERGLEESPASFAQAGSVLLSITRYIRPSLLAIDACFNQSVVAILESDTLKASFIYPLITNEIPRYMMLRTGAQQPHINKETVDSTFVVVPPTVLLSKYYETADRLLDLLVSTAKESEELTDTKNFLLPLLMNGQVTIGDDGK